MEGVDEWRPSEASRDAGSAGHPNGPGEALITRSEVTLEGIHRCLDPLGSGSQFLSERRQSIASKVPFDQAVAHALLKLCNATLHRGLIDAENLGSCLHAARARERQEMPEIVPCKRGHGRSMQFCEPNSQSFDCPAPASIGIVSSLGAKSTGRSKEMGDEHRT